MKNTQHSTSTQFNCDPIEFAKYPILFVPFHGTPVPVKIRELTEAQTRACGDFSLIETIHDRALAKAKKVKLKDLVSYSERSHAIVKAALVCPTYNQIFDIIGTNDPLVQEKQKILDKLKEKLKKCPKGPQRSALEEEILSSKIWCNYLLPSDFTSYITAYSLGIDKSDIKLVSEKMLLDASILAEKGHNDPAKYIDGLFTPFMKNDINRRAWYILAQKKEEIARKQKSSGRKNER